MGMIAVIALDIAKRDVEDVWENLQASLVPADGIEPIALSIVFETYDVMVFCWCEQPENLTNYIIDRLRSLKGVMETMVFFMSSVESTEHGEKDEPGLDGVLMLDVESGLDKHVFRTIKESIKPEEEMTFTKFIAQVLHSTNLDLIVGYRGINLYHLDQLFSKIRLIEGVRDLRVEMFSRFKTLVEYDVLAARFPWFL